MHVFLVKTLPYSPTLTPMNTHTDMHSRTHARALIVLRVVQRHLDEQDFFCV